MASLGLQVGEHPFVFALILLFLCKDHTAFGFGVHFDWNGIAKGALGGLWPSLVLVQIIKLVNIMNKKSNSDGIVFGKMNNASAALLNFYQLCGWQKATPGK
jgi:hypothetical protein